MCYVENYMICNVSKTYINIICLNLENIRTSYGSEILGFYPRGVSKISFAFAVNKLEQLTH